MTNVITFVGCAVITLLLLMSIMLAGPHLLLPATFMIVVILVGGFCVHIAGNMIERRTEIMKDWKE